MANNKDTLEFVYKFGETLYKAKSRDEFFYAAIVPFVSNEYLCCSKATILLYNEDNQIIKGAFGLEKTDAENLSDCSNSNFNKTVQDFQMSCGDIINLGECSKAADYLKFDKPTFFKLQFREKITGLIIADKCRDYTDSDKKRLTLFIVNTISLSIENINNDENIIELKKELFEEKQYNIQKNNIYNLGKTSAMIIHEVKNSLIGIIGIFNKLRKYTDNSDKSNKYSNIISKELDRIYNFLLDINKYSKSRSIAEKSLFNLNDTIKNSIDMVRNLNETITFKINVTDNAEYAYGESSQIEQVITNLLKNSIEAIDNKQNGVIILNAEKNDSYLTITIEDNAGGIDEKHIKDIFKPFYTTKNYGTGLGLSIVSEIINEHNGTINVENIKGKGAKFSIKLPMPVSKNNGG